MQRIIEPALAKANMSKTELGRRMGVTQPTICQRIQRGKFTLDELCKIAHCMGQSSTVPLIFQMELKLAQGKS